MNDNFFTISQYIESKVNLLEKIQAYNALIDAMELKLLEGIGSSTISEYQMDDGQMKVRTTYRSISDLEAGITALEKSKQRLINRYNGRNFVLRSGNIC